jgi:hypothetical protein
MNRTRLCNWCRAEYTSTSQHMKTCPVMKKRAVGKPVKPRKPKAKKATDGALKTQDNIPKIVAVSDPRVRFNPVTGTMDPIKVVSAGRFESNRRK